MESVSKEWYRIYLLCSLVLGWFFPFFSFLSRVEKPRERNIRAKESIRFENNERFETIRRSPLEGRATKPCRSRKERRKEKAGSCSPIMLANLAKGSVTKCR